MRFSQQNEQSSHHATDEGGFAGRYVHDEDDDDDDDPFWGLPDPHTQSEFYADVTTKRFIAFFIDFIVILAITVALVPFTAFTAVFYFAGLMLTVSLVYRIATLASGSATLGMRVAGIEFRTREGQRFDLGMAALHTLLFSVWSSTFFLQLLSIVLMLSTARAQGLSDVILGTAAINRARRF